MGQCSSRLPELMAIRSESQSSSSSSNRSFVLSSKDQPGHHNHHVSKVSQLTSSLTSHPGRRNSYLRDSATAPLDEEKMNSILEASMRSHSNSQTMTGSTMELSFRSYRDGTSREFDPLDGNKSSSCHVLEDVVEESDVSGSAESPTSTERAMGYIPASIVVSPQQELPPKTEAPKKQKEVETLSGPKSPRKVSRRGSTGRVLLTLPESGPSLHQLPCEEEPSVTESNASMVNPVFARQLTRTRSGRPGIRPSLKVEDLSESRQGLGKESSWMALSCTSGQSSMYSSYKASLNGSIESIKSNPVMDMSSMEKKAMNNLHGFCFTESDNDSELSDHAEDKDEPADEEGDADAIRDRQVEKRYEDYERQQQQRQEQAVVQELNDYDEVLREVMQAEQ